MVDVDLVAAKLTELSSRVQRVREHVPREIEEMKSNQDTLDLVAFNLMLAVQSCLDIASHIIADEEWAVANTLGDSFERLQQHGVLSQAIAQQLRQAVGLRNVVAHGYAGIDLEACFQAATKGLADLDAFAREVGTWLASRAKLESPSTSSS